MAKNAITTNYCLSLVYFDFVKSRYLILRLCNKRGYWNCHLHQWHMVTITFLPSRLLVELQTMCRDWESDTELDTTHFHHRLWFPSLFNQFFNIVILLFYTGQLEDNPLILTRNTLIVNLNPLILYRLRGSCDVRIDNSSYPIELGVYDTWKVSPLLPKGKGYWHP